MKVLFSPLSIPPIAKTALAGILISNLSHFLAVISLYKLTFQLVSSTAKQPQERARIAFAAAILHTVSPAGIFLSAPYGESIFACLSFAGMLAYAHALHLRKENAAREASGGISKAEILNTVQSGLLFGLAATVRGNGLLNGILFLWDAMELVLQPQKLIRSASDLSRLAATILAGILTGAGFAGPQVVAYLEFCTVDPYRTGMLNFSIYLYILTLKA